MQQNNSTLEEISSKISPSQQLLKFPAIRVSRVCIAHRYSHDPHHSIYHDRHAYIRTYILHVVGTYNDTRATEYCMKIGDTTLAGVMFLESKQTR